MAEWIKTYDPGDTDSDGHHRRTICDSTNTEITNIGFSKYVTNKSKIGIGSHLSGVDLLQSNPCGNGDITLREYPTYNGDLSIDNKGVLLQLWILIESQDISFATDNRFSPLTVKGKEPKQGELLTTHIGKNGLFDIGHAVMTFQSQDIKVELNKWSLHSLYIRRFNGLTKGNLYVDGKLVVEAISQQNWLSGRVRGWHAGYYSTVRKYPYKAIKVYNDHFMIVDVDNLDEALQKIQETLGNTQARKTIKFKWSPVANINQYLVSWGRTSRSDEDYEFQQETNETELEIDVDTGFTYYGAVQSIDSDGNISNFSKEDSVLVEEDSNNIPDAPENFEILVED